LKEQEIFIAKNTVEIVIINRMLLVSDLLK